MDEETARLLVATLKAMADLARNRHLEVLEQLQQINREIKKMSQQVDTLVSSFGDLVALFGTFATDTTTALADIAAKQGDPADAAKIQSVIDGATSLKSAVADLDAKVKAADPGAQQAPPAAQPTA